VSDRSQLPLSDDAQARARRREERRHRLAESTVPSPCVAICQIDETSSHCIGCLRTLDEIREWIIMDDDEKRRVLARIAAAGR